VTKSTFLLMLTVIASLAGLWSYAHQTFSCRDYFSECTEGGCSVFDYTSGPCKLYCQTSSGIWKDVKCYKPGSREGDTVPTDVSQ